MQVKMSSSSRDVFITLSSIQDGVSIAKMVTAKGQWLCSQRSTILDLSEGSEYASEFSNIDFSFIL